MPRAETELHPSAKLHGWVPRHATRRILEAIRDTRVVVINGPRQCGKSSLLKRIAEETAAVCVTFDDTDELHAAKDDPRGYLESYGRPLYIDEAQLAGDELIRQIKRQADLHQVPGQFVLTGSSRFLQTPALSESLAGRVEIVDLWPLSVAERAGARDGFVDALFGDDRLRVRPVRRPLVGGPPVYPSRPGSPRHPKYPGDTALPVKDPLSGLLDLCVAGGFPEPLRRADARRRRRWFESYVSAILERDVAAIRNVHELDEVRRLLSLLAAGTTAELNHEKLGKSLAISGKTVSRLIPVLEHVYAIQRIPAWSSNRTRRAARRAKSFVVDTGVCCALLSISAEGLRRPTEPLRGPVVENFVLGELLKDIAGSERGVRLHHYRDHRGREVDLVLEAADGTLVGVEVKAARTAREDDFKHLKWFRDAHEERFHRGIVFYAGDRALPFGPKLMALPVRALWERAS